MTILHELEQWEIEDRRWWRVVTAVITVVVVLASGAVVYALRDPGHSGSGQGEVAACAVRGADLAGAPR